MPTNLLRLLRFFGATMLSLGVLAPLASPAAAETVRYEDAEAPDLYTAANYLELSPEAFIDASIAVHAFLLIMSDKTDAGGACGEFTSSGSDGSHAFTVTPSESLDTVMGYYCFSAAEAAFASTSLLAWLTALDAQLRGLERVPVDPPPAGDAVEQSSDASCEVGPASIVVLRRPEPLLDVDTYTRTLTNCPDPASGANTPGDDHCTRIGEGSVQVVSWTNALLTFTCSADPAWVWQRAIIYEDECDQAVGRRDIGGELWSIRLVVDPPSGAPLWELSTTLDAGTAAAEHPELADDPDPCSDRDDPATFCNALWPGEAGAIQRADRISHAFRLGGMWSDSYFQCAGNPDFDEEPFCHVVVHNELDPFSDIWRNYLWPEFNASNGDPATCTEHESNLTLWNGESICSISSDGETPVSRPDRASTSTMIDVSELPTLGCS